MALAASAWVTAAGATRLVARAVAIAGRQACDVKGVRMCRVM